MFFFFFPFFSFTLGEEAERETERRQARGKGITVASLPCSGVQVIPHGNVTLRVEDSLSNVHLPLPDFLQQPGEGCPASLEFLSSLCLGFRGRACPACAPGAGAEDWSVCVSPKGPFFFPWLMALVLRPTLCPQPQDEPWGGFHRPHWLLEGKDTPGAARKWFSASWVCSPQGI